jgi:hypothetical protein
MNSCIFFSVKSDGSTELLCTHSRKVSLEFGVSLVGKSPATMILPLEGLPKVRESLRLVIQSYFAQVEDINSITDDEILDIKGLTLMFDVLSRYKPNNRMISHLQIEMV